MSQLRSDPVAIRLPEDVLRGVDAVAAALDRPRSWVMVRALRAYLAQEGQQVLDLAAGHREAAAGGLVDGTELLATLDDEVVRVGGRK